MAIFIHDIKDNPDVWVQFNTKKQAKLYMKKHGGSYISRSGKQFNPEWTKQIQEQTFETNNPITYNKRKINDEHS